jgi:hypothetical protein
MKERTMDTDLTTQRDREVERTKGRKMPSPFSAKVVGVSFVPGYPDNLIELASVMQQSEVHRRVEDWEERERVTAVLRRNPANEYDANAVEVHVPALGENGFIGHVVRPIAARLAPDMDAGGIWHAEVGDVLIDPDHMDRPGITINCKRGE